MLTNGKNYIHSLYNGTTKTRFISSILSQGLLLPTSDSVTSLVDLVLYVSPDWWIRP